MSCTKESCKTRNVFEELDRGLNQFVRGVLSSETSAPNIPASTVSESEDRYQIECDLPGVPLEDIDLSVEDYVLKISGKRKKVEVNDSTKELLDERSACEFSRSFQLAKNADVAAVDAELSNGVLFVTVMKRSEVLPKKIQIRRSSSQS
jgi:HSP20 family protein